ncbi:MAG: dienelactone hydrolase family protein [Pirellulales bacterium]
MYFAPRVNLLPGLLAFLIANFFTVTLSAEPLPGTQPLSDDPAAMFDYASDMVDGIDRFLMRKLEESVAGRAAHWQRDFSSTEKYNESVAPNRKRLAQIIGAVDERTKFDGLEFIATTSHSALVGKGQNYEVFAVRWPVFRNITGEGLLLRPIGRKPVARVVAIPDADQTPEMLAGLVPGVASESQFARRLAESGCLVVVPALIDRGDEFSVTTAGRGTNQTHREFVYRPAFEMGRHIIGYEVQKVLAVVDWFAQSGGDNAAIGLTGYGEGGLLALYSGALDTRVDATLVSGYFNSRQAVWSEPIYRNVFALLNELGDAELASLIAPRPLVIEACRSPEVAGPPTPRPGRGAGAAPGELATPEYDSVEREVARARALTKGFSEPPPTYLVGPEKGAGDFGSPEALELLLFALERTARLADAEASPEPTATKIDSQARLKRQFDQLTEDTQHVMREGEFVRKALWAQADRSSIEKFVETSKPYREHFYNEVIGRFDDKLLPPNARTEQIIDEPAYTGYRVVLDVFDDVFAYGILLVPKGMQPGERRPVVVCQHGLEGRPEDVADPKIDSPYYHQFANKLTELGFITYSPQNPYIFKDRFRVLQRKLNPLKKTLYSIIVPQHQQTVDWLATLPNVDPGRIGFYGLSYGGKTAMRVPALVDNYCLSICSGDFNEWIWKNASLRVPLSYPATGEYEIFEWDLGNTYNYAEMAALIAPRPFMVERGHRDGVGIDEWVNYEYAKVRLLYVDLKIAERTTIEHFDGPHEIHAVGTFDFLHEHLHWPRPTRE